MKVEGQVITPEQAMKLKELGVEQKASFYYVVRVECTHPDTYVTADMASDAGDMSYVGSLYQEAQFEQVLTLEYGDITKSNCEYYAALNASDLFELLPDNKWCVPYRYEQIDLKSEVMTEAKIVVTKFTNGYESCVMSLENTPLYWTKYPLLPHSLADLLIYLLENNLTTPLNQNENAE